MKLTLGILIFIVLGTKITAHAQICSIAKCDTLVDTAMYVQQNKMIIDGKLDEKNWRLLSKVKNVNPILLYAGFTNTVTFGTLWNEKYLYVGVKVLDAQLFHQPGYTNSNYYPLHLDDAVELFINASNSHISGVPLQIVQAYKESNLYPANAQKKGMIVKQSIISGGYSVEFAIPWDYLFPPEDREVPEKIFIGKRIGFDVANDDDDNGNGERQYQIVWNNKCDNDNYLKVQKYGIVVLSGNTPVDAIAFENSITGPVFLCEADTGYYYLQPKKDYTYSWQVVGGSIIRQSATSVVVRWDQKGTDTLKLLINNTCGPLRPNAMPIKVGGPVLTIAGIHTVCPAVTGIDYWLADTVQNTNYQWFVIGGTIAGVSSPVSIKVNWGGTNPAAMIKCLGKDQRGCYGDTTIFNVNVSEKLKPPTPLGDTLLCFLQKAGKPYSVLNATGSTYTWAAENGTIKLGQGTNKVVVDWGNPGTTTKLSVYEKVETSLANCKGGSDTIAIQLMPYDSAAIDLIYISLKEEDESKADVKWQVVTNSADSVSITFSNGVQQRKLKLEKSITTYTFEKLSTRDTIYFVSVISSDLCGYEIESKVQNTIQLKGTTDAGQKLIKLTWNEYKNWPSSVKNYEIWRKLEDKQFIKIADTPDPRMDLPYSNEALKHTYKIKAIHPLDNSIVSFSNAVTINFEVTISGANVITPNEDGINDFFVVENLSLYAQKDLKIYSRWGNEVFHSSNYENNWNASGLTDGVYFYYISYGSQAKDHNYKGWIQVLR